MFDGDLVSELLLNESNVYILAKGQVVDHIAEIKVVTLLQNHAECELISGVSRDPKQAWCPIDVEMAI
jgi:hypothetical protein